MSSLSWYPTTLQCPIIENYVTIQSYTKDILNLLPVPIKILKDKKLTSKFKQS